MRSFTAAEQAALAARTLVARDFMQVTARDRDTGNPVSDAFWSDVGKITVPVIDPDSGAAVETVFHGAGALVAIDPIPAVANLTVQRIEVRFSQIEDRVNALLRQYDLRQAKVVIWRGNYDPDTRLLLAPARVRFVGTVDGAPVETPQEGGEGSIKIECVSSSQEYTLSNPDTRSHESQQQRAPGDDFFKDVAVAHKWTIFWGKHRGPV